MGTYYLKHVNPPDGQMGYPFVEEIVHCTEERANERFKNSSGFVLYEKIGRYGEGGLGKIYAYGFIDQQQPQYIKSAQDKNGKQYKYGVKVKLSKKINAQDGIPVKKAESMINKKIRQGIGGLVPITKDGFDALCVELDKVSYNLVQ